MRMSFGPVFCIRGRANHERVHNVYIMCIDDWMQTIIKQQSRMKGSVFGNRRLKTFKAPELDKLVQKAEIRYTLQNSIYTDLAKEITSKMGASHEAYPNALGWDIKLDSFYDSDQCVCNATIFRGTMSVSILRCSVAIAPYLNRNKKIMHQAGDDPTRGFSAKLSQSG